MQRSVFLVTIQAQRPRCLDAGVRRAAVAGRPTRAGGGRSAARSRGIVRVCVEQWAAVVACATRLRYPCCMPCPSPTPCPNPSYQKSSWRLWVRVLRRLTAVLARSSPGSPSSSRLPSLYPFLTVPTPTTPPPFCRCSRSPGPSRPSSLPLHLLRPRRPVPQPAFCPLPLEHSPLIY
ncbi:hypothetical protein PMIN03_002003 [Paraphaeosphaeria minitans]